MVVAHTIARQKREPGYKIGRNHPFASGLLSVKPVPPTGFEAHYPLPLWVVATTLGMHTLSLVKLAFPEAGFTLFPVTKIQSYLVM